MTKTKCYNYYTKMGISKKCLKSKCFQIVFVLSASMLFLLVGGLSIDKVLAQAYPFIANTRGSFDLTNGDMVQQPILSSALSILTRSNCPGELAIYVHGVWASEQQAEEQTDRLFLSLQNSGSHVPVIGFSWDSDTAFSRDDEDLSQYGWTMAKRIANQNGPILAKFIADFKDRCPNDDLRIIAHSMGSRVTLSAIQSLYDNNPHDAVPKIVKSVHLLGAAVDNEQVSTNNLDECISINNPPLKCSGEAISLVVEHFYNLYNPEDNMLSPQRYCPYCTCPYFCEESPYHTSEKDNPLGAYPVIDILNVPLNYYEYSVWNAIGFDEDANGDGKCDLMIGEFCTINYRGDNHYGYMGYRSDDIPQVVYNSGAMGSVVIDWRNERD